MKNSLVALVLVLISGCSQSSSSSIADATTEGGWTNNNMESVQSSCKQTIVQSNKFTQVYAATYCHCIFGSISSKWSYSDLQQKEASIMEALNKEGTVAKCLQDASESQSGNFSQVANAAGMPDGFFGVKLNSTIEDAKAVRPNVREGSGYLEEVAEWNGKTFNVSYEVNPISNQVFFISLERTSDKPSYMITSSELNSEFGPLPSPAKSGPWLLKSERVAGGVKLIHVLSDEGAGIMKEQIMLSTGND